MLREPNYQHSSSSLENLRLISYCPLCSTHYNPSEAKVLEEKSGAHLIHVSCQKCSSSIVAVILTGGIGVSSVGLITDLTGEDVLRFKNAKPVSSDDVLEAYELTRQRPGVRELLDF
ncbi:MAG: hypothetical protein HYT31_03475 [Parcubacteria group bacterium]|nr:hypothetical protein [Parcubacteria group bacterium]